MKGYPGKLDPKLKAHINTMLARFSKVIRRREGDNPLRRVAALFACVRLAHQKANSDPERKFWKWYLDSLQEHADRLKQEHLKRMT